MPKWDSPLLQPSSSQTRHHHITFTKHHPLAVLKELGCVINFQNYFPQSKTPPFALNSIQSPKHSGPVQSNFVRELFSQIIRKSQSGYFKAKDTKDLKFRKNSKRKSSFDDAKSTPDFDFRLNCEKRRRAKIDLTGPVCTYHLKREEKSR